MSRGSSDATPSWQVAPVGRRKRGRPRRKAHRAARRTKVANAALISRPVLARTTWICSPRVRAAASTSLNVVSVMVALAGLTSTATRVAAGISSRRSPSRFATSSLMKILIPVRLPPGRAMLVTRPSLAGSSLTRKTIGMFAVAALAANAEAGPPPAAITATRRRTNSAASCRQPIGLIVGPAVFDRHVLALNVAGLLQALAEPTQTLRVPAVRRCGVEEPDHRHRRLLRARRSGRAAAAPPSSVMNSRRFMSDMGLPSAPTSLDRTVCTQQR